MFLDELRQNSQIISAIASTGGFLIWTLYAVLFYSQFRRQSSSHLFIHAAGDGGPGTECLIINLSSEPVHLLCSLARSESSAVQIQARAEHELSIKMRAKQGPLETGEWLSLGTFSELADDVVGADEKDSGQDQSLEIRVAAIHGLNDQPVGATRSFFYNPASSTVVPSMAHTEQKRSRRASRLVKQWMEECKSYRERDA